ncbi:hypothetical protein [Desulfotruncus alcoholivorax]|nr:hypothetical protein [Desulfotruncus alcoholivorax]
MIKSLIEHLTIIRCFFHAHFQGVGGTASGKTVNERTAMQTAASPSVL